jgi:hypothetical protein
MAVVNSTSGKVFSNSNFTGIVQYQYGKRWYKNGQRHRIDGPAIIQKHGDKYQYFWFLYYERYSKDEYNRVISNLPLLYWSRHKMGLWV